MTLAMSRRHLMLGSAAVVGSTAALGFTALPDARPDALLMPDALKADLAFWRLAVLERHPRLYDKSALDPAAESAFQTAISTISGPLNRAQAFRIFGRINPLFKDAHTLLLPWLSGAAPDETEAAKQFPFGIKITSDARILLRSSWRNKQTGAQLAQGMAIKAINNRPSHNILTQLLPYSHGETPKLQLHMLQVMFAQWLDSVLGWRDSFDVTIDGGASASTVRWRTGAAWEKIEGPVHADVPTVEWLNNEAALLRVPTFDVDEFPEMFATATQAAFHKIRQNNIRHLIIDVRGNTGGQSDAASEVIRNFLKAPAAQVSRARERMNDDNNGMLGYHGKAGSMREMDVGEKLMQPLPTAERFTGKVTVLIDELTYSAGILFATTMQDLKLAQLVGKPTGGYANQTGNMMPTKLPNTGFTAFIATRDFIRPSGDVAVAPVQPDILVEDNIADAEVVAIALKTYAGTIR